MTATIDLLPADRSILLETLRTHLAPNVKAWVFGSRATGTARRYSDLDLALEAESKLDTEQLGRLRDALSESDLTIKVDVLDLRAVDPDFKRIIANAMLPLPLDHADK
jgi:predicted nucleotidyltransferase